MASYWETWDSNQNSTFTLNEAMAISFTSAAATLAFINLLMYLYIFKLKKTTHSRLITAFLLTWWIGAAFDYCIDILLPNRDSGVAGDASKIRTHITIDKGVVRLLYIASTEIFNWSLYTLFSTICSRFHTSHKFRRVLSIALLFESSFALINYSIGIYEVITLRSLNDKNLASLFSYKENTFTDDGLNHVLFDGLYKANYCLSALLALILTVYFSYTFYLPQISESAAKRSPLWAFSSGAVYLASQTIIYLFFSIITAISANTSNMYDVRISVLSTSIRYSAFLMFLLRVRRNSTSVHLPSDDVARILLQRQLSHRADTLVRKGSASSIPFSASQNASTLQSTTPRRASVMLTGGDMVFDLYNTSQENISTF